MTCISGLVAEGGAVYIGGDSAGVNSRWNLLVRSDHKIFTIGEPGQEMALGFTDSFRMGQVLRYSLALPAYDGNHDLYRWMVTVFIDSVRDALKKAGFATKDKEQEAGGTFLVGFRGRLFSVHGDYQVAEAVDGMNAIGSADQIALGVLWATKDMTNPEARILLSLEAAERFSAGVRRPFVIVKVSP